jgi:glyoxylase-like metal-dependent hydrolase (beta-lactamase superfamily II)
LLDDAAEEIERLRLTDAELAALLWFAHYGLPEHRAATLRGLLERTR